jgi:hypothetical protein
MGYLNNSAVTVDAILTLKGRELLAKGGNAFNITQFALGDDEVDYSLWNEGHQEGSDYYGILIESMPVTEAVADETQALRYKLVTLPKSTTQIPVVTVGNSSIVLVGPGDTAIISPNTSNLQGGNSNYGYTAILADSDAATIMVTQPLQNSGLPSTGYVSSNEDNQSVAVAGFAFQITAKTQVLSNKTTTITIIGNETGGSTTVNLTVNKLTVNTANNSTS